MAKCIRLYLECIAICNATAQLMSIGSSKAKEICAICADICNAFAEEYSKHKTEHCQEGATPCKACATECFKMAV